MPLHHLLVALGVLVGVVRVDVGGLGVGELAFLSVDGLVVPGSLWLGISAASYSSPRLTLYTSSLVKTVYSLVPGPELAEGALVPGPELAGDVAIAGSLHGAADVAGVFVLPAGAEVALVPGPELVEDAPEAVHAGGAGMAVLQDVLLGGAEVDPWDPGGGEDQEGEASTVFPNMT